MSTQKRKPTPGSKTAGGGKSNRRHKPSLDTPAGENVAFHHAVQPETGEHVEELREECAATHEAAVAFVVRRAKRYKMDTFVSLFLGISLKRRMPKPGTRAPQLLHEVADRIQQLGLHRRVRRPVTLPSGAKSSQRTPDELAKLTLAVISQIVATEMLDAVRGPGGTPMSQGAALELLKSLFLCHRDPRAPGLILDAVRDATSARRPSRPGA